MLGLFVGMLVVATTSIWAQMPDARQMSGIPMPVGDVQVGTVVVRLVRGALTDNIVSHAVELQVGDKTQTARTNANGHAQFDGLAPGATARASAVIDGRRLESQPFQVPASGGIRLILAAGADGGGAAGGGQIAPIAGEAILGGDSRIQIEFDDDALTVFYIFDIVNAGAAPVSPKSAIAFDLPEGAEQPTLLEGSSTQATLRGRRVSIAGPFAPGSTPVQIAFGLPPAGSERVIAQVLPVTWARVQVIATKLPGLSMTSPQFASTNDVPGDTHNFILGTGAMLESGKPLSVALAGVPSRNHAGRFVAIALAVLVLIGGIWGAATATARTGDLARKAELEQRRTKLMADLVRLEKQQRTGAVDATRYASRRSDLFDQLERVYGELDQHTGAPGEGLVA
ncbi:MAG: hypothetical protein NT151_09440 [Acidobacteria bacterium]|nr:hypothetical protein [Acidobacteriota bacterium]